MIRSRIISTGSYLPENVLTNKDLEARCDTTDEWIRKRTGIEQRHMAAKGQPTSDLALQASIQALERANLDPADVDSILLGTLTPDYQLPATASLLQDKLGAKNASAMDINAACSGFMYGMRTADGFIKAGHAKNVLLVGAEVCTSAVTWEARDTAVLFGDGAGAVVIQGEEGERGMLSSYLRSDGSGAEILWVPGGGSAIPFSGGTYDPQDRVPQMNGKELFKRAVVGMEEAARKALDQTGLSVEDIDFVVPHQANSRIIQAATERLGVPLEKVVININKTGNTVHATIPIALDEAVQDGRIKENDIVLFVGFGAGLTWGSSIYRW